MFKLKILRNQKVSLISVVQILFYTFPLSFVLGNLAVSLNCVLFVLFGLFLIKQNRLAVRFGIFFWLLFIFLLFFFINTLVQFKFPGLIWKEYVPIAKEAYGRFSLDRWIDTNGDPVYKTFFLVRFLLLMFVAECLFFNKILNLKKFFLSSCICTTFVSLDILLQYFSGTDLFGYEKQGAWSSGPFGDEKIATSYLKNFSFFSFFYIFDVLNKKKYNKILFIFFVTLHLLAALLGGNRMPMLILIFGCILIILFISRLRILMSLCLVSFSFFFYLIVNNDQYFKVTYSSLLTDIIVANKDDKNKKLNNENLEEEKKEINNDNSKVSKKISLLRKSSHNRIFWTALIIWKEQPLTGLGFKSYRLKCVELLAKDIINKKENNGETQEITCANHAHNYYLEILTEAGVLGLSCFLIFFIILLKNSYHFLRKSFKNMNQEAFLVIPLILIFFLGIWPIQSTGSFFTTWNATGFWLNIGILCSFVGYKKIKLTS